jgi:hypothetical protein
MEGEGLSRLVRDQRTNAIISWALVGLVAVASLGSLATGDLLWAGFTAVIACIAITSAVSFRNVMLMPPWEVLLLACLPTIGRLLATTAITGRLALYFSVAALALLVAVDLDIYTAVEMNDSFAVLFVVVTTMATAGLWAVVRWLSDLWLGTGFITTERALMIEFVASATAGLGAGLLFVFYFRRLVKPDVQTPGEVEAS